jgi:hypothetical protein
MMRARRRSECRHAFTGRVSMACRTVRFFGEFTRVCTVERSELPKPAPEKTPARPAPEKGGTFLFLPRDWYGGLFARGFQRSRLFRGK